VLAKILPRGHVPLGEIAAGCQMSPAATVALYFPVLTKLTQSPWFLNVRGMVKVAQEPLLALILIGWRAHSLGQFKRSDIAGGYALVLSGLAAEIVLIDANRAKAEGEAMDLNHAVPFTHPTRIWAGDYADCAGAAVTVLAAGVGQKPGQSRLECLQANARIWRKIIPQIAPQSSDLDSARFEHHRGAARLDH
jgi:hypothetical protein